MGARALALAALFLSGCGFSPADVPCVPASTGRDCRVIAMGGA